MRACGLDEAAPIILRHEWLKSMPTFPKAAYALETPSGELAGVVVFGLGHGTNSRGICGPEWRDRVICLERGACVHWAHPHAASFLISRAVKMAARDHGWRVFHAYADPQAHELGVVY